MEISCEKGVDGVMKNIWLNPGIRSDQNYLITSFSAGAEFELVFLVKMS